MWKFLFIKIDDFQTSDLPQQPSFLVGSIKVNQRSEKHRFGLDVRVDGHLDNRGPVAEDTRPDVTT